VKRDICGSLLDEGGSGFRDMRLSKWIWVSFR